MNVLVCPIKESFDESCIHNVLQIVQCNFNSNILWTAELITLIILEIFLDQPAFITRE